MTRILWSAMVSAALLSLCIVAKSQGVANPREADVQRWNREKQVLVEVVDKIEVKLTEKFSRWKTSRKEVLIPPQYSNQHSDARLVGKGPADVELEIDVMNSATEAGEYYHLNNLMLASGKASALSNLGDEAVSITGPYTLGRGQVRFMNDRILVIVFARTPQEAAEIAGLVDAELEAIMPKLPKVD